MDLFAKGHLSKAHTLVLQWDGASENVAKTNWRLSVWLLMQRTGLRKIIHSRLDVGHSHFDVDQRHGVFARFVRGQRKRGAVRKDVHSLSSFEQVAWSAHSDLREFVELGKLFDFDTWLAPMRCRLEEGMQVCTSTHVTQRLHEPVSTLCRQDHLFQMFERIGEEVFVRSAPHMGEGYPLSARRICWPPPSYSEYRNAPHPALPVTDRPALLPMQEWKQFKEVRVSTTCPRTHIYNTHKHIPGQSDKVLQRRFLAYRTLPTYRNVAPFQTMGRQTLYC